MMHLQESSYTGTSATPVPEVVLCRSNMKSDFGFDDSFGPSKMLISFARRCSRLDNESSLSSLSKKHLFMSVSTYRELASMAATFDNITTVLNEFLFTTSLDFMKCLASQTPLVSFPWVPPVCDRFKVRKSLLCQHFYVNN